MASQVKETSNTPDQFACMEELSTLQNKLTSSLSPQLVQCNVHLKETGNDMKEMLLRAKDHANGKEYVGIYTNTHN